MKKASEVLALGKNILKDAGVDTFSFDAAVLFEHVYALTKTDVILNPEKPLDEREFVRLCTMRAGGEPLQYLVGSWEFMGLDFYVDKNVLIPRADTETLIDTAKKLVEKKSTVIDLCSGSGCIGVTLEKELDADVFALEKSEQAFEFLKKNIALNDSKVIPVLCDVLDETSLKDIPQAELVVSNPPYIKTDEIKTLSKEVCFEPEMALDGDKDGLKFYREITHLWKDKIKNGGYLVYEIGYTQAADVSEILSENGFEDVNVVCDICENPRVVYGKKR